MPLDPALAAEMQRRGLPVPGGEGDQLAAEMQKRGLAQPERQQAPPQESLGGGLDRLWQGLKHDFGSGRPGLKQAIGKPAGEIAQGAGETLSDLWQSLSPSRAGADAGGRVVGKVGDIAGLATGGLAGPELPPAGKLAAKEPAPMTGAQQTYQDMGKLGMSPNVPAVSQRRPLVPIFNPLRALPFSPIERGLQQNVQQAGQAAETVAGKFDPTANAVQAGRTAQEAIKDFADNKTQVEADYGEFDRLMHGAKPVDVTSTVAALKDLYKRFPSVPRLAEMFTNSKLGTMLTELEPRYQRVEPKFEGATGYGIATPGGTIRTRGWMTVPEVKELRTRVMYMMADPSLRTDIPQADLAKVRAGLTSDLDKAARARGPEAVEALQRANDNYRQRQTIIERLEKIVDPDAPERAFERLNAAAHTSGGDVGLLRIAHDVIPPEKWKDIGAAVIRRLGYPVGRENTPGLVGPDFSLLSFRNNWLKLSPEAKGLLFGEPFPGTPRDTLETIARMGANKALTYQGGAHMVGQAAGYLGVEYLLRSLMTGNASVVPEVSGLLGVYALSKALMAPSFAKVLYRQGMTRPPLQPLGGMAPMMQGAQRAGQTAFAVGAGKAQEPRVSAIGP